MRFSYVIMNPPYENSLHLRIIEVIISHTDKIVNISPIRWLQDPMSKYKKISDFSKFKETIADRIESLDIIPANDVEKLFNVRIGDLGISMIGNGGYDYSSLQNNEFVSKIISKMKSEKLKSFDDIATEEGYRGPYKSELYGIISSHYGDLMRWFPEKWSLFIKKRENNCNKVIFFSSEEERKNCFNFLCSDFMRKYARESRKNQRVHWQFVPWLDFSHSWTEEELNDYFKMNYKHTKDG